MGPRTDLVERAVPLLPPGSQVRQVFVCQTAPHFAYFFLTYLTGLTTSRIRYRCVAVTQDAIYVMDGSKRSGGARPASVVGTLPRSTRLGPVSGRWGQLDLFGERYWVHRRFHEDVATADADLGLEDDRR